MTGLGALIRRNCKLFFKDKGMFFTSLITPVILLVLYATFLAKVYRDSFAAAMPAGFAVDAALIDGTVGGQLVSSLLAVCCVTVAFCSNLQMVQDKISGARRDLTMSPLKRSTLALSYFASSALSTVLICFVALGACLIPVLSLQLLPSSRSNDLSVSFSWDNAGPELLEMEVTTKLEGALARTRGLREIVSETGNGWGTIRLSIDKEENIDAIKLYLGSVVRSVKSG